MTNAEDFFNIIMNKHQGAIGNLDISEYNRNLVIFKNLIIRLDLLTYSSLTILSK